MVTELVEAGAAVDCTDDAAGAPASQRTALHLAALGGFAAAAEELLRAGATVDAVDAQVTPTRDPL